MLNLQIKINVNAAYKRNNNDIPVYKTELVSILPLKRGEFSRHPTVNGLADKLYCN